MPSDHGGGSENRAIALLTCGMVLVGAIGWWIQLRPDLQVDARSLETLPRALGSWSGDDIPLRDTVEAKLRADANLSRSYRNPLGDVVWLYDMMGDKLCKGGDGMIDTPLAKKDPPWKKRVVACMPKQSCDEWAPCMASAMGDPLKF